jgi:hypothetical protein
MSPGRFKENRPQRIGWGESADVLRLPEPFGNGSEVVRITRRQGGTKLGRIGFGIALAEGLNNFYSLKTANLVAPEHYIQVTGYEHERTVTDKKGEKINIPRPFRMYSRYYPLPPDSAKEINAIKARLRDHYRGRVDEATMRREMSEFDRLMEERYPLLMPTAEKVRQLGFPPAHPQVNFTVHNGKILFYEAEPICLGHMDSCLKSNTGIIMAVSEIPDATVRRNRFMDILASYSLALVHSHTPPAINDTAADILTDLIGRAKKQDIISSQLSADLAGAVKDSERRYDLACLNRPGGFDDLPAFYTESLHRIRSGLET